MIMNKTIFLFILLLPLFCSGKDYQVKLNVKNLPADARPLLLRIYNGNMFVLDSIPAKERESVTFKVPENTSPGMFRAILGMSAYAKYSNGQASSIDLLFNKEDIELSLDFNSPSESLSVIKSKENQVYCDFLKADALLFKKLGLLEQVVITYPDKDEFYQKALEFYKKLQLQREKFIDKSYSATPELLASKIIRTKKIPITDGDITPATRDSIFKSQFLDKVDFNDTTLLYTSVYTDKVFQFIQLFMRRDASPRENEANIIRALDIIVPKLSVNETIQTHLMQFLLAGFESMKMEEVLAHISANYLQQCGGDQSIVKRRLEGYQKMSIGKNVPDFTVMDIDNNPFNLYSSINPYTLIIFWHTDCNHCKTLMDELPAIVNQDFFKKHQVEIVGISIDSDKANWENFSLQHPMDWVNTYAPGSFDSEVAAAYNLFATPSMFLLDDTNTIIAKPTTIDELKKNILAL